MGTIAGFGLGGRDSADGFEQAAIVELVDPFQGGELDGFQVSPRAATPDHLGLIGPEGPTVRNRTVAYFLHYLGADSQAAGERSKVRSRNQHSDWKRLLVGLDMRTAGCSGTRQATAASPPASVFPTL